MQESENDQERLENHSQVNSEMQKRKIRDNDFEELNKQSDGGNIAESTILTKDDYEKTSNKDKSTSSDTDSCFTDDIEKIKRYDKILKLNSFENNIFVHRKTGNQSISC
jgi:hypothetical protein